MSPCVIIVYENKNYVNRNESSGKYKMVSG